MPLNFSIRSRSSGWGKIWKLATPFPLSISPCIATPANRVLGRWPKAETPVSEIIVYQVVETPAETGQPIPNPLNVSSISLDTSGNDNEERSGNGT